MSLDWNTENCNPPRPVDDDESSFRTSLVYLTLGMDLGSVTEENVDEWVWRIWHQKTAGLDYLYMPPGTTPQSIRAQIARWVGLYTNVETKTREEYLERVKEVLVIRTNEDLESFATGQATATDDKPGEDQPA